MAREAGREGFRATATWRGVRIDTLRDVIPQLGGILLIGINPSPPSVQAGHYYQGRLGRRLWARLDRLGLLVSAARGREDEAFADLGNGLTDIVKRPTVKASDLSHEELTYGANFVREKIRSWKPVLILFSFQAAARCLLGKSVRAGRGPLFEGVPTFLLSGPYASTEEIAKVDAELVHLLQDLRGVSVPTFGRSRPVSCESLQEWPPVRAFEAVSAGEAAARLSQRVTGADKTTGIIRFPKSVKTLFPSIKCEVEVILRGIEVRGSYDPRTGPDRERSAVLRVGKKTLAILRVDEKLIVSRDPDGTIRLD